MPALREKVEGAGLDMYVHSAKEMRSLMRKDLDDMAAIARVAKIKAE